MTYVEGFVCAVPTANKVAYKTHAEGALPLFKEFGVVRMVETWGDDVPHGKQTDFYKAVEAKDDETIVFSWFEYPDKTTRDAATAKMMEDPRMAAMGGEMPFDGSRMIVAGFESIVDDKAGGTPGYVDGYVLAVPSENKDKYRQMADEVSVKFREFGAVRVLEGWGDDVPDGKVTDYKRAVQAQAGENVVYSFVEWPDKATRDAGWEKLMADPSMQNRGDMPFDGGRMFWGGFRPLIDA